MLGQALLLAGGRGTRLGALTDATPKPVLPVAGRPFLDYLLWNLARQGVGRAVVSSGYLAEELRGAVGAAAHGVSIDYVVEDAPMGTGGAVRLCADRFEGPFLVLNGDTLFDADLGALARRYIAPGAKAAVALRRVDDVGRYGAVTMEGDRVSVFAGKGLSGPGWINGGIYVLDRPTIERLPEGPCSLESLLMPALAEEGALAGLPSDGFFLDIGLPETFEEAQTALPAWQRSVGG